MFIPADTPVTRELRPAHSKITATDWAILADYWYPVAIARDLADEPLAAQILDVPLVVYRGLEGRIGVAVDTCPHRHVRLSAGQIVEGELECPFHGLRFDTDGRCQRIPALGRTTRLPESYRVRAFPTRERYGLVWTCLGNADRHDVPHFPLLSDTDPADFGYSEPKIWPVSAPRQVENFADLAHLPFIHATTLGGDQSAPVKPARIDHGDDYVMSTASYMETGRDGQPDPHTLIYRIVLPFAVEFSTQSDIHPEELIESCDLPVPISAYQSRVFQVVKMPGGREAAEKMVGGLQVVNDQDVEVLETLMRPDLPLDQRHEIHLPVDNISSAYRGRLRKLGLGATPETL